jgi:hypothetical protein
MTEQVFFGPDDLSDAVLAARRELGGSADGAAESISNDGLRRLIRLAYYTSQTTNEGRFPRMTLLVPKNGEYKNLLVPFQEQLSPGLLHRIFPIVSSQDHCLVVCENGGGLSTNGVGTLRTSLVLLSQTIAIHSSHRIGNWPAVLTLQINGPGDLRVGEYRFHRLRAGCLYREASFRRETWFSNWIEEFVGSSQMTDTQMSSAVISVSWLFILRLVADLHHGGCILVVPDPSKAPIRQGVPLDQCDLGGFLREYVRETRLMAKGVDELQKQRSYEEMWFEKLKAVAGLSATDGCMVFDRNLRLHSFGSMIEGDDLSIPCFPANDSTPLDEAVLRSFGARRQSALHLCRAVPGAMAFVVSQDGDLRLFVRKNGEVWFFDNAAYW